METNTPQLSVEDLLKLIQSKRRVTTRGQKYSEESVEPPRFVIYARKSTQDDTKQETSIEQQISECEKYAQQHGLLVTEIIREEKSAKRADRRDEFATMIHELRKSKKTRKFDSILCWHPDRLSRNMKDAGEIMDLLDDKIIKELRFVSYAFTDDASNRMALGVIFVFAQNYSEKLSEDVKRGNRDKIQQGRAAFKTKHGYYKNSKGAARPDGKNFELIKQAFAMRLAGKEHQEIANFLNKNDYKKMVGKPGDHHHAPASWNKQKLSSLFAEPFYCGLLLHGPNWVDLTETDPDFVPIITVEEYLRLNPALLLTQDQLWREIRGIRKENGAIVDLMRGKVICDHCDKPMALASTKKVGAGHAEWIVYYRCENKLCTYLERKVIREKESKKNQLRAKEIVHYAQEILDTLDFTNRELYDSVIKELRIESSGEKNRLKTRARNLKLTIASLSNQERELVSALGNATTPEAKRLINSQIESELPVIREKREEAKKALDEVIQRTSGLKETQISYEQFSQLMGDIGKKFQEVRENGDITKINSIMTAIFSNIRITDKKVTGHRFNEPYDRLLSTSSVMYGGRFRTRT